MEIDVATEEPAGVLLRAATARVGDRTVLAVEGQRNKQVRGAAQPVVTSGKDKEFVLDSGKRIQSIFGREVDYLKAKGYTFMSDGTAVKVK
jgi:hypothetical protein